MDWLEQELQRALRRKEPSADLTARVIRQTRRGGIRTSQRWLAAAAAILIVSGGALGYRRHRGMEAKEQVLLAFRITAANMNHIQARVQGAVR